MLAEERRLVREAWSYILNKDARFQVIAECGSPESALLQARDLRPDIIIQEIKPPELSGIEMVSLVRKFSPGTKVLGVSLYTFPNIAREVMMAGASGYLTKTSSLEEMLQAVIGISEGEDYLCSEIKKVHKERPAESSDPKVMLGQLSIREIEIVIGIKNGFTSCKIAVQLNITKSTVEKHRYNILKKLNLNEDPELVAFVNKN
ncbi:MAG: response regulator [Flavisolibacter sp.]